MASKMMRFISTVLVILLLSAVFAGCKDTKELSNKNQENNPGSSGQQNREDGKDEDSGKKPIKLTYWTPLENNTATVVSNLGEVEMVKEWQKRFNVEITFKHPPTGQEREQFNLIIASRDLPDFIEYNWLSYPGGPEKAITDNIIIKLNDIIDQHAPNFKNVLDTNEVINKQVRTDSGTLYVLPAYSGSKYKTMIGPVLRKDWLDDLGLQVPETINDWTQVLTEFKEQKGAQAPFTCDSGTFFWREGFNGPFMVGKSFYIDNGEVRFGPMEPGYKEYLKQMHEWYAKGLLDPDFAANNTKAIDAKITHGQSGAFFAWIGGGMGKYLNTMKDNDPKFDLVAAQYPVMNKGDQPVFLTRSWEYRGDGSVAITTVNKYPAESAKLIDYLYSEEGSLLKNFGIEGLTYNMDNGYPKYTDVILNNPDGLSMAQVMGRYTRGSYPSPGYIDGRYHEQYFQLPQQKEAASLWAEVSDNALAVTMPPITHTPEEAEEVATIMATVESYQQEMAVKFVMGQETLDNFDKYLEELKKMRIDRVIELKQNALDRYNSR